jgi:acetyl/propionyl-CoA carboxylase alpha subunit
MKKLLIANRAEIARRIIKSAKKNNLKTVQIYGLSDEKNSFMYDADEAVYLEGNSVSETYLNIEQIIAIAKSYKADLIHPGYGFLSESPTFATAVQQAGITFIGPSAEILALTGDKRAAKKLANDSNVPTLPSLQVSPDNISELETFSQTNGFPLIIKAAFGGGGRGMRIINSMLEAKDFIERARNEAQKFFASPEVFVEPYLKDARHVEMQILADHTGEVLILGSRDCSMQRSHQKVIEEAPAPFLSEQTTTLLHQYAAALAKNARYVNAGTVEFLIAKEKIYFLEINARIQVEHPVTEELFGIDLIDAQIKIASGKTLKSIFPTPPMPCGHTIEARICAENPRDNFSANNGLLQKVTAPLSARFDSGFCEGDFISYEFDSMIAKVIARGDSRDEAIKNLRNALTELMIDGVCINSELLISILDNKNFQSGTFSTNTLDSIDQFCISDEDLIALYVKSETSKSHYPAFRIFGAAKKNISFSHQGRKYTAEVQFHNDGSFTVNKKTYQNDSQFSVSVIGSERFLYTKVGQFVFDDSIQRLKNQAIDSDKNGAQHINSPLPGTIAKILVTQGETVLAGQTMILLESMKMEHEIKSPVVGTITSIHVTDKSVVKKGTALVTVG